VPSAVLEVRNTDESNIFNIFFVLGISSGVKPLPFQQKSNIDIGVLVLASVLLFAYRFTGGKRVLDKWEGAVFVVLYAGYIVFRIFQG
jgi:cation:H+ antiporter